MLVGCWRYFSSSKCVHLCLKKAAYCQVVFAFVVAVVVVLVIVIVIVIVIVLLLLLLGSAC